MATRPSAPAPPPTLDGRQQRLSSNLKQIGLGLRMLANENTAVSYLTPEGRLSPELIKMWDTESAAMRLFDNVTLLVSDAQTMAQMERERPGKIVARTINAFGLNDGTWGRFYLQADGSVTLRRHTSDQEIWDGVQ